MGAVRLDHDQLQQLTRALLDEQQEFLAGIPERMPSLRGALRFALRGARAHDERRRQSRAALDASFAQWAAVDQEVAAHELGVLRQQASLLLWWAVNRRGQAGEGRGLELYPRAVAALTAFYFGTAPQDDGLLAQTQLAFTASRDATWMLALSRPRRGRRANALLRYRELWDEWARAQPAPATT